MMYPYASTTRRPSPRSRRGFTLIELLVVIAIIALLVSILLPSLTKAKQLALRVVCSSNHKNLAMGHLYYTEENDGWYAPTYKRINPYTFDGITRDAWLPWYSVAFIGPYIGNEHPCATAFSPKLQASTTDMIYCPLKERKTYSSNMDRPGIGYNSSRQNYFTKTTSSTSHPLRRAWEFEYPDRTFLLMDVEGGDNYSWNRYFAEQTGWPVTGNDNVGTGYTTYRHLDSTPVAFANGSVITISKDPDTPADSNTDGVFGAYRDGILTHKAADK